MQHCGKGGKPQTGPHLRGPSAWQIVRALDSLTQMPTRTKASLRERIHDGVFGEF